ncbi:MAG: hypothetical protein NVSMB60_17440 [Mycobacterium sp.]
MRRPVRHAACHTSSEDVVIVSIPLAQKTFMLDPSNVAITSIAVGIGRVGAAAIEATWRVQGRILKEPRRMWRAVG